MLQDALHKKASPGLPLNAVQLASDSFSQAKQCIFADSTDVTNLMTLDYVESVAKLRFTLEIVAWLIYDFYYDSAQINLLSEVEKPAVSKLIISVEKMCSAINDGVNQVIANFLLKCIVRKYGMSTLINLCDDKRTKDFNFSWLIPNHLQKCSYESQVSIHDMYGTYIFSNNCVFNRMKLLIHL